MAGILVCNGCFDYHYYQRRETAATIEVRMGMAAGRLAEIRMELRKKFFARLAAARETSLSQTGGPSL
jgi:hypothetical protein